ncbi:MAG: hypothetical protein K0S32_742 [Bacteroidetes bacterium]|jgi:hypothetical protein|nr:hypothetical protein [Bacteroidota bacterium]
MPALLSIFANNICLLQVESFSSFFLFSFLLAALYGLTKKTLKQLKYISTNHT